MMTLRKFGTAGAVALAGALLVAGCSGGDSGSSAANALRLGDDDLGPVTSVSCKTDDGLTTITIEGAEKAVVKVTDEDNPTVKSVHIGEVGSTDSALVYVAAVSGQPAQLSRDGKSYTISGTGMGTSGGDAVNPVDTAFELSVSCP